MDRLRYKQKNLAVKGSIEAKSVSRFYLKLGFMASKGTNSELVSRTTDLSFLYLGGRYVSRIVKKGSEGFWNNLDYEGRLQIGKSISASGTSASLMKKFDGYAGVPVL